MVGDDDGCKTSCDVNNDHNDEDDDDVAHCSAIFLCHLGCEI